MIVKDMSLYIVLELVVQREASMILDEKKDSLVNEFGRYVKGDYPKFVKVILLKCSYFHTG